MNNDIRKIDLTRSLPPALKTDETMLALANVIGKELQKNVEYAGLTIIYARIDELGEDILDVLAYDLHVDWYDYSYPIDAKRAMIKDSVKVHKRLGTKFAVETALGNLHPNSKIEEWFEYGGRPFFFRVILDTTHSRVAVDYFEVKKAVNSYKRLSAHMDDLIYQCSINVEIEIEAEKHNYKTRMTGMTVAGTYPQRETIGAVEHIEIEAENELNGFGFNSRAAGTAPKRSRIASLTAREIEVAPEGEGFRYGSIAVGRKRAGEHPQRQVIGENQAIDIELTDNMEGYTFTSRAAGTDPKRNTGTKLSPSGIYTEIEFKSYKYKNNLCGTMVTKSK